MKRIEWIDGMKGICALVVVMSHFCAAFKYACPVIYQIRVFPILGLLVNGNLAVYIFIMLSAILMYNRGLNSNMSREALCSTFRKRYFRLTLPIGFVFICAFLLKVTNSFYHLYLGKELGFESLLTDTQEYSNFILGILLSVFGNSCGWLNIMWMMKYIFFGSIFSLCMGLALVEVSTVKRICYILLFAIVSYFIDYYYCAVCGGWLICEYSFLYNKILCPTQDEKLLFDKNHIIKAFILICSIIIIVFLDYRYSIDFVSFKNFPIAITLLILIFSLSFTHKFLSLKLFVWLGKLSYELFLIHLLVLYSLSCYLYVVLPYFPHEIFVLLFITLGTSIILAYIICRFISPQLYAIVNKYA